MVQEKVQAGVEGVGASTGWLGNVAAEPSIIRLLSQTSGRPPKPLQTTS